MFNSIVKFICSLFVKSVCLSPAEKALKTALLADEAMRRMEEIGARESARRRKLLDEEEHRRMAFEQNVLQKGEDVWSLPQKRVMKSSDPGDIGRWERKLVCVLGRYFVLQKWTHLLRNDVVERVFGGDEYQGYSKSFEDDDLEAIEASEWTFVEEFFPSPKTERAILEAMVAFEKSKKEG